MAEIDLQISSGTPERSMNIDAGYLELRPLLLASKTFKAVLKPQSSTQNITRPHEINDFNVIFCKFTTLSQYFGVKGRAKVDPGQRGSKESPPLPASSLAHRWSTLTRPVFDLTFRVRSRSTRGQRRSARPIEDTSLPWHNLQ